MRDGLAKFNESLDDYYTQWEHSRLPVGIGVRIFSSRLLLKIKWSTFQDLVSVVINKPRLWRTVFENKNYCSYPESRIDSRLIVEGQLQENFVFSGYNGFLKQATKNPLKQTIYSPKSNPKFCDERGMPATFGFESFDCAKFPTYIMLDITNVCNSHCTHCPHSLPGFSKNLNKKFISIETVGLIADECSKNKVKFIRITADGEPLLHPEIKAILEKLTVNKKITVGLTTNGSLLNKDMVVAIGKTNLGMIDISLDAAKEETYKKIRKGLSFGRVHQNIDTLLAINKTLKTGLKIFVSFVEQTENFNEHDDFQKNWEKKVDKVLFREMTSNVNMTKSQSKTEKAGNRWPCPHVFRRMIFNYNEKVKSCPIDWSNKTELGTIENQSLKTIWHSDAFWELRIQHLNQTFSQASLCCDCSDWAQTPWEKGYEKIIEDVVIPNMENSESKITFNQINNTSPKEVV